jgi:hypothetical protein
LNHIADSGASLSWKSRIKLKADIRHYSDPARKGVRLLEIAQVQVNTAFALSPYSYFAPLSVFSWMISIRKVPNLQYQPTDLQSHQTSH